MLTSAALVLALTLPQDPKPASRAGTKEPPAAAAAPHARLRPVRPVAAAEREALGFPEPRRVDAILADLDAIATRMPPFGDDRATWAEKRQRRAFLQRERVDLVSELEEAGYQGPRLMELLAQKLDDLRAAWPAPPAQAPRREMAKLHADEPVAARARIDELNDLLRQMRSFGLHLASEDYERVAAAELARKDDPEAGMVLLDVLHFVKDQALVERWRDWIEQNLPATAAGRRWVARQRSFGKPVQLDGVGFDGEVLDTKAWKGSVVLVDFWGMWCQPCREAMPELKKLHERYHDQGLRVVGILCDHKVDDARKWLAETGYDWPQMVDRTLTEKNMVQHPMAVRFAIGAWPKLFIIDRDGVLREEGDRGRLEEQVRKYLKN